MNAVETATIDYCMPSLGADMNEGSIIAWSVGVGDAVERGQVVARVETEKSDIDIEIWREGVVSEIVVGPNRMVPVGTVLMRLRSADRAAVDGIEPPVLSAAEPTMTEPTMTEPMMSEPRITPAGRTPVTATRSTVWASPLARRLAGERGIALDSVIGSGPDGAVRQRDLSEAAPDSTKAAPEPQRSRTDRMRTAIAARMERSSREIPHYRLQQMVDLDPLLLHLSSINADRPVKDRIVPAAAFVRAVAIAASKHGELNGTWVDDQFSPGREVNVAVAISLRSGGLVTPIVRLADQRNLDDIMGQIKDFTAAARAGGTLRSEWTGSDSTITVTNLGERGADLVHGLISPPEVALVGFGRILERPWVIDGSVVPRHIVTVTLGADHRATDGAVGSRFLATLAHALEKPEQL